MVKKVVGVGLASVIAISLWSTVPPAARRVLAKIRRLERVYRYQVAWSLDADKEGSPVPATK